MIRREKLAGAQPPSTAFGKYQITSDTSADIQKAMGLPGSAVATPGLQDRMTRELLNIVKFDDFLRGGKTSAQQMQRRRLLRRTRRSSKTAYGQGGGDLSP